jgi:hypothetical protein
MSPVPQSVQFLRVSSSSVCPVSLCVQILGPSPPGPGPPLGLSSPPVCPGPWCVHFRGMSSSLLCPVPRRVQTIGVSSSLVSPNPWCVQFLSAPDMASYIRG